MTRTSEKTLPSMLFHALCATLLFLSLSRVNAQSTSPNDNTVALYVFGDSLYDTGMGLYNSAWPSAQFYPYGITYFKKPAGRYSDGRLIPDFIAQYANMSFPQPYLKPNLTINDYTTAINFAVCSSGVLVDTRPKILNLKGQVNLFLQMVTKMNQQLGENETTRVLSNAVYLFNTGGNDYVDLYNLNTKPLLSSLRTLKMNQVIGNLTTHFTTIYNQGGRKFAYNNLAPMGCLPAYLHSNGSCVVELNDIANTHNQAYVALTQKLKTQLPGSKFSTFDFYNSLLARLANGTAYGFTESQPACCGSGLFNGKFTCQKTGEFSVCSNPTDYLWFDAGHPSQKADEQFAQEFWSGSSNVVAPYNLQSFFEIV